MAKMSENYPQLGTVFPISSLSLQFGTKGISRLFQDVFQKDKEKSTLNMTAFHKFTS